MIGVSPARWLTIAFIAASFVGCKEIDRRSICTDYSSLLNDRLNKVFESSYFNTRDWNDSIEDAWKLRNWEVFLTLKQLRLHTELAACHLGLDEISDVKSSDGKVRILSWDSYAGGTAARYYSVALVTGDSTYFGWIGDDKDSVSFVWFDEIFKVATKDREIYLAKAVAKSASAYAAEAIIAFTIDGGLKRIDVFHHTESLFLIDEMDSMTSSLWSDDFDVRDSLTFPKFQILDSARVINVDWVFLQDKSHWTTSYQFNGEQFVEKRKVNN